MDYERVFGKLLESRSTLALSSILLDFEKGTLQAAVNVFPGATIAGCLFHLGQSLWSRIQNEGLANNYHEQDHTEQLIARFNAGNQTAVTAVKTSTFRSLEGLLCCCPRTAPDRF